MYKNKKHVKILESISDCDASGGRAQAWPNPCPTGCESERPEHKFRSVGCKNNEDSERWINLAERI